MNDLAADNVLEPLRALAEDMQLAYEQWLTEQPAEYPTPGSEIPRQRGYVVGTCGHRVAGSEWRAGFRTCERCPDGVDESAEHQQSATR